MELCRDLSDRFCTDALKRLCPFSVERTEAIMIKSSNIVYYEKSVFRADFILITKKGDYLRRRRGRERKKEKKRRKKERKKERKILIGVSELQVSELEVRKIKVSTTAT